jgi:hypothetical protein
LRGGQRIDKRLQAGLLALSLAVSPYPALADDPDTVSGNVHWREVESMLTHLGATVEPHHGASFRVVLNGVEGFIHRPHNNSTGTKDEIRHVRDFLIAAGIGK